MLWWVLWWHDSGGGVMVECDGEVERWSGDSVRDVEWCMCVIVWCGVVWCGGIIVVPSIFTILYIFLFYFIFCRCGCRLVGRWIAMVHHAALVLIISIADKYQNSLTLFGNF